MRRRLKLVIDFDAKRAQCRTDLAIAQKRRSVDARSDAFTMSPVPLPLLMCPDCNVEMRLLGIEPDEDDLDLRDTYTFECIQCGRLEIRSVRLK